MTAARPEPALPAALESFGADARDVQVKWRLFAAHARSCGEGCTVVAQFCRRATESDRIDPHYNQCCEAGRPLFGDWRIAVQVLRDTHRRSLKR